MIEIVDFVKPLKRLARVAEKKYGAHLGAVACFFLKNGAVVSSGVNHATDGGAMEDFRDGKWVTRAEVVHAEVAAIAAARENGVDLRGAELLLTMSPCLACARELAKTGIVRLYYVNEWWDVAGLELLREAGVETIKLEED